MNMGSLRESLLMPMLHNLHEDEDEDELDTEMMIMGQTPGSFTKKSTHLAGKHAESASIKFLVLSHFCPLPLPLGYDCLVGSIDSA